MDLDSYPIIIQKYEIFPKSPNRMERVKEKAPAERKGRQGGVCIEPRGRKGGYSQIRKKRRGYMHRARERKAILKIEIGFKDLAAYVTH